MDKTGGPAFPVLDYSSTDQERGTIDHITVGGMTLRDYFAAKVLPTFIAEMSGMQCDDRFARASALSTEAYEYADAMIAARSAQ